MSDQLQKFRVVLLIGPPGSGKGTLGRFLSLAGNHYHLSSGDVFRGLDPESPAGKLYNTYGVQGKLVPDEVTLEICKGYIDGLIATNRYFPNKQLLFLDGLPRTAVQAEILDKYVDVVKIIKLEMPDIDKLVKRMQKRAIIEKRADDANEEVLKTRMEVYAKQTLTLLDYYPKDKIASFNADQKPLEVLRDVLIGCASILA